MIEILVNIGIIVGVIMVIGSIVGLIATRKSRDSKKSFRKILWILLVVGLILAITPYALLLWAVLTI